MMGTGERPALSALPFAVPKSALPGAVWPAVPDDAASRLLALQFQLEQSQWWPSKLIEARQFEQLRQLLAHAQRSVSFHAPRLAAAGFDPRVPLNHDLWLRIPIMTRTDVQLHKEALRSRMIPPEHGAVGEASSSGSTGRPITVYATEYVSLLWHAFTLREHFWHRRDLAGKLCAIRHQPEGGAMPPEGGRLPGWGPATDIPYRTGPCSVLNVKASIREQADWLAREDPDYLITYPLSALELLRFCHASGFRLPKLRELRTFSEAVPGDLREFAREMWGAKVVDMYTAREVGYIALQCPERDHYHVQSENLYVEILNDAGKPCAPGKSGRVVVTTLHNFATPLIRYDIGDYAEVGEPCTCGRGLPVLKRILGRVRSMLTLPNGERYYADLNSGKVHHLAPILQQQVAQVGLNEIELRLVVTRAPTRMEEQALAEHTRASLRHAFHIAFRYVDEIPRGPTGKFEEFVSELDT